MPRSHHYNSISHINTEHVCMCVFRGTYSAWCAMLNLVGCPWKVRSVTDKEKEQEIQVEGEKLGSNQIENKRVDYLALMVH